MKRIALATSMLAFGCAGPRAAGPEPTPTRVEPSPEDSARPPDVPPAAPATLGVNDMAGHPARWNGETIVLFARLRYEAEGPGPWLLVDAEDERSMTVVLRPLGIEVPARCTEPSDGEVPPPSPCGAQALDLDARYRLEGQPRFDRDGSRFEATRIELTTEAGPP
ncbi:MAG: hypothetical protein AAF799_17750 [Myxococcota bacterium]